MDHETAVQVKAAERYFLGELTGDDLEGFEEHFFECADCAEDVRMLSVFAANAKVLFETPAASPPALYSKPMVWASALLNAALALALGYTLIRVVPTMRRELAEAEAPQFVQDVPVLALARGGETTREIASSTRRIVFSFYLREPYRSISYQISDAAGVSSPRHALAAPPHEESTESHFSISTAGLAPGVYEIRFWGAASGGETAIGQSRFKLD